MSDFTPGPWKCDSDGVWSDEFGWVLEPDSDKCYIKVADMHLIAESPSMYAVLDVFVELLDKTTGSDTPLKDIASAVMVNLALARSILAKVRGE